MPYKNIDQALSKNKGLAKYSEKAKDGWLKSFNSAIEQYHGDESKAYAVAYSVANKIDSKKSHLVEMENVELNLAKNILDIAKFFLEDDC